MPSINKSIIFETAFASEVTLLEESSVGNMYKLKFRAKLQEADIVNNNRRVYPAETLMNVYSQLKTKALERKLVGEMDHPQPSGDNASKIKRSSTLALDRVCVLFTELEWDGSAIYGICETLTNTKGMDLYALLKDGVTIGFSLRAFGETRQRPDGITEVLPKGVKALTYDVVANPSHDSSVILEFINESESIQSVLRELKTELTESKNSFLEESNTFSEGQNKTILEESKLSAQLGEATPICLNNICTFRPLEEAIEYLITESIERNNKIPKIKVKQL